MFNAFLKSFDTAGSPQAKSIFNDVAMEAGVKSGNKYMADAMEEIGTDAIARQRGFSIDDVRLNNGIYDVSKIRFGPKDFAEFNINKFMDNLGIGKATEDLGRDKMMKLLGKGGSDDFYKFTAAIPPPITTPDKTPLPPDNVNLLCRKVDVSDIDTSDIAFM